MMAKAKAENWFLGSSFCPSINECESGLSKYTHGTTVSSNYYRLLKYRRTLGLEPRKIATAAIPNEKIYAMSR